MNDFVLSCYLRPEAPLSQHAQLRAFFSFYVPRQLACLPFSFPRALSPWIADQQLLVTFFPTAYI